MNRKYLFLLFLSGLLIKCNTRQEFCKEGDFEKLELKPVNVIVMLPAYKIADTSIYDDERTILDYKVKSVDSMLDVMVFIKDYMEYDNGQINNLQRITELQKGEVENLPGTKNTLIKESYKQISGIRVGYLKYLVEHKDKSIYEGRIYFYRDKQLVTLWLLEKYENDEQRDISIIDCVLESMKIN